MEEKIKISVSMGQDGSFLADFENKDFLILTVICESDKSTTIDYRAHCDIKNSHDFVVIPDFIVRRVINHVKNMKLKRRSRFLWEGDFKFGYLVSEF